MKVLITCPPMLGMKNQFMQMFEEKGIEVHCPEVVQTLSERQLMEMVPHFDGWIIGDDPASRHVFEAGSAGRLKAAVKWGVGVDNVDFDACREFDIPISNTPDMFGREVADVAVNYLSGLARETYLIDRHIRAGKWPKYRGISLANKTVGLIGYGDIGKNVAKRLHAAEMIVIAYDPAYPRAQNNNQISFHIWPEKIENCDFLAFTCALNEHNVHMLNAAVLEQCKRGVRIVNVARGPLIDEEALIEALSSGHVHSAALDVFEHEPLPSYSRLREMDQCIFGSHNSSNTSDAVSATNEQAIRKLFQYLGV